MELRWLWAIGLIGCGGISLLAQQPFVEPQPPKEPHELSAEQAAAINFAYGGVLDYRYSDHCRAGFAQSIRPHALPSRTRYYGGYYVGGGAPLFGEGRLPDEGTFGWDFLGVVPKRVDRIRVIALPASNALLIQATPLDLLTIRRLLDDKL